ncbi:MAG: ABC transporter permease [Gemmatimonadetes bacterium]|nr:ABC transporter permease [Gemmatimonadota bacterium]
MTTTAAPTAPPAASPPPAPRTWRERSLVQLTLVRMREFWREPEAVFWTFGFPLVLAGGLAIAFRNKPPEAVPIGVVTGVPGSEQARASLRGTPGLVVDALSPDSAERALRTGAIAVLVVPQGDRAVEYRYDRDRAEARTARLVAEEALQRGAGRTNPVATTERQLTEPGSRYIDFFIPGLLGMNLMGSSVWSIAFGVVNARSKKLLKRLTATPMSRAEYLLSFMLSRMVFLAFEVLAILGLGTLVLGVPLRGSLAVMGVIILLAAFAFSAIGLLVAARTRTVEAASGFANLVLFPMWIFSGVFFASTRFPELLRPFIAALPLTATNDSLRAVMLQGAGLGAVWPQLAVLAAWLVICFPLALMLFRWR